jgi:hypothetical protein
MTVGAKRRIEITKSHVYGLLLLIGLLVAIGYAVALAIERTAPINPVTGFHMSVAGSILFFAYPVAVTIQAVLFLMALWLFFWGIFNDRMLIWWAFGVLGLGFTYAALNYLVSI